MAEYTKMKLYCECGITFILEMYRTDDAEWTCSHCGAKYKLGFYLDRKDVKNDELQENCRKRAG